MGNAPSANPGGDAPPPPPPPAPVDDAAAAAFAKHSSAAQTGSTITEMFDRISFDDPYAVVHTLSPQAQSVAPEPIAASNQSGSGVDSASSEPALRVARMLQTSLWSGPSRESSLTVGPVAEAVAEAELRGLTEAIRTATVTVRANAAAAREAVSRSGGTHGATQALLADVDAAEAAKLAALAAEAAAAESALSLAVRVCRGASAALASGAAPAMLALQASQLEAVLRLTPPRGPVEPTMISFAPHPPALALSTGRPGCVLAPKAVKTAYVRAILPSVARPGKAFTVRVVLQADAYPTTDAAELTAALAALAFHVRVEAAVVSGGSTLALKQSSTPPVQQLDARCVLVTFSVPGDAATRDAAVGLSHLSVSGRPSPSSELPQPVPFLLSGGMLAPLLLQLPGKGVQATPAISGSGELFAPTYDSPSVAAFSPEGVPLAPIDVAALGLSRFTRAAAVCDASGTLLLADFAPGDASVLVALDLRSRAVRWRCEAGALPQCCDIVPLSSAGVVVAGSKGLNQLVVLSLRDGKRIGGAAAAGGATGPTAAAAAAAAAAPAGASVAAESPRFLAADQATGVVYASSKDKAVAAWKWDGAAQRLVALGRIDAAGEAGASRLLAVVPPAPGKRTAHLVVGTADRGELLVIALPDHRLVHRAELPGGAKVTGLAGDPTGTALAVCDAAGAGIVRVLQWPLEGMSALT
jgi:hypothetical protein